MAIDLNKYREIYFSEASVQLDTIARHLDRLEQAPADHESLEAAFRAAHTLKGISATMGYDELTQAAHSLEDLLTRLREAADTPDPNRDAGALTVRLIRRAFDDLSNRILRVQADSSRLLNMNVPAALALSSADSRGATGMKGPVRVAPYDLNLLLDLVAELVASSSELAEAARHNPGIAPLIAAQRRQLRALQTFAWQLNMAPLSTVFNRFPRMLQEIAREQGEDIRIEIEGGNIELCHAVLEDITEPLLHLLRNAIAHGIEPPSERQQAGKPDYGTIYLTATRAGERVRIETRDDGRGLDAKQILDVALEQGLITPEARETMTDDEAFGLIMLPGFSLARAVTPIAGRGVGMSVVKARLEACGGRLEIRSKRGRGASFTLDVPRLIDLVEVELVRRGSRVYAVPSARVAGRRTVSASELATLGLSVFEPDTLAPPDATRATDELQTLVLLEKPRGAALRVDELLGKALLNASGTAPTSPIPILEIGAPRAASA